MNVYVLKSSVQYHDVELNEKTNYEDLIGVYTSLEKAIEAICDDVESSKEKNSSIANIAFKQLGDRSPMDYDERRTIGTASFDFGKFSVNITYSVHALVLDNFIEDEDQIHFKGEE